ncbi:MAG: hypothetical protein ABW115_22595 [Candidatus Thiodiazotropha sp. 6PLUC6]
MTYYPAALPEPELGGIFTTAEGRIESEGDISPRTRVINPNHRQTLQLNWILTEQQYRIFESWHRWRLHDGVSRFDVDWAGRSGRARFTAPVQASLNGRNWSLSSECEIDYGIPGS